MFKLNLSSWTLLIQTGYFEFPVISNLKPFPLDLPVSVYYLELLQFQTIFLFPSKFKIAGFNCCIFFDYHMDFCRYESNSGGEREIQRTMLELLNQLDGFDSKGDVKVTFSVYLHLSTL